MVTPLGNDPDTTWQNLVGGRVRRRSHHAVRHDGLRGDVRMRAEGLRPDDLDRAEAGAAHGPVCPDGSLCGAHGRGGQRDRRSPRAPDRVGAAVATGIGGLGAFEDCFQALLERGPDRTSPFSIIQIIPNMAAAWVSMELGTRGPLATETTACAASNMAIGDGLDAIRLGRADVMLCGGTEAPVTRVGIAGFSAMRALSQRNDDPKAGSRPFDADRDGFVMGEAGAMVVLEELEHARARGAKIYAELLGYGVSSDARHVTEPDPTGENPARAMQMAFSDAGISPGAGRLRQRTRDLHARRRPGRDPRAQARARRGACLPYARLLDEGRDGALPRRRRRGRGDLHDLRDPARGAPAHDQLRDARSPVRSRLHPERGAARSRRRSESPTRSASAATTRASSFVAGTKQAA